MKCKIFFERNYLINAQYLYLQLLSPKLYQKQIISLRARILCERSNLFNLSYFEVEESINEMFHLKKKFAAFLLLFQNVFQNLERRQQNMQYRECSKIKENLENKFIKKQFATSYFKNIFLKCCRSLLISFREYCLKLVAQICLMA